MSASETLPRGVRFGYGSGSVATGAFGTGRLTAKFPRFTPLHRA